MVINMDYEDVRFVDDITALVGRYTTSTEKEARRFAYMVYGEVIEGNIAGRENVVHLVLDGRLGIEEPKDGGFTKLVNGIWATIKDV